MRNIANAWADWATANGTLTEYTRELDELQARNEQDRAEHLAQLRAASVLGNQISALESRQVAAQAVCDRGDARRAELKTALESLACDLASRRAQLAEAIGEHDQRQQALDELRAQVVQWRAQAATARRELAAWRERHIVLTNEPTVLEELERRLEGLSLGVREVLVGARENTSGPLPPYFAAWWPTCCTFAWKPRRSLKPRWARWRSTLWPLIRTS